MKKRLFFWLLLLAAGFFTFQALTAQSGGGFDLSWSTLDGGGGDSGGGSYALSGTIGQPDAGKSAGGSYTLQGGFWRSRCAPLGTVQAGIRRVGSAVELSWTAVANATGYTVYRALNDPHFTPGSPYAAGVTSPWTDPDGSVFNTPGQHYFYLLRAGSECGETTDSTYLGVFNFGVVPGT